MSYDSTNLAWAVVGAVVGISALVSLFTFIFFPMKKSKKNQGKDERQSVYQTHGQSPHTV